MVDVYLWPVPSDPNQNDVRLRDPTTGAGGSIVSGAGTGALAFAGTAEGAATNAQAATGAVVIAGTAAGSAVIGAAGSGAIAFAGTAAGSSVAGAAASGAIVFDGTATGPRRAPRCWRRARRARLPLMAWRLARLSAAALFRALAAARLCLMVLRSVCGSAARLTKAAAAVASASGGAATSRPNGYGLSRICKRSCSGRAVWSAMNCARNSLLRLRSAPRKYGQGARSRIYRLAHCSPWHQRFRRFCRRWTRRRCWLRLFNCETMRTP